MPEGRRSKAWDSVRDDLAKQVNKGAPQTPPAATEPKDGKPPVTPPNPADGKPPTAAADPNQQQQPQDGKPQPGKGKQRGPWQLVDDYKARALKAETELADVRKRALPEDEWKKTQERLTNAEKRAQEYEDHLRYSDYSKSEEFQTKYQKPYEKAWAAMINNLGELTITDPQTNAVRPFEAKDMLALLNLRLPEARRMADELYGPLADDVMAHRKTIQELYDQQQAALEDAKKNGAEREKTRAAETAKHREKEMTVARDSFDQANKAVLEHPEHGVNFKHVEGDDELNTALDKGYAFAQQAFGEGLIMQPGLSLEQRATAAKRHAALINRAAAYGRLHLENKRKAARIAKLEKELAEFRGSVPGGGQPTSAAGAPNGAASGGTARQEVYGELYKLAKPR